MGDAMNDVIYSASHAAGRSASLNWRNVSKDNKGGVVCRLDFGFGCGASRNASQTTPVGRYLIFVGHGDVKIPGSKRTSVD